MSLRNLWRSAPWTVNLYAAVNLVALASYVVLVGELRSTLVGSVLIAAALVTGLVAGSRAAWVVAIFFALLGTIGAIGIISGRSSGAEQISVLHVIQISSVVLSSAALLHSETRRWVWHPER